MKGVSTVIATILMLMITIALAGMAYVYISGVLTGTTGKTIKLLDVTCDLTAGNEKIIFTVKNLDPKASITVSTDLTFFWDNSPLTGVTCSPDPIPANGGISQCTYNFPAGDVPSAGSPHTGKVVGPSNKDETSTYC